MDRLADEGSLRSVKEVRRELERNCRFTHVSDWVRAHRSVFRRPSADEEAFISEMFTHEKYREFVRRQSILKGLPVADPFIIASAKVNGGLVVTMESRKSGGARIPTVCDDYEIECTDLEGFLERERIEL
jgi:hypothetical protein